MSSEWCLEEWLTNLLDHWPDAEEEVEIPRESDAGKWLLRRGFIPNSSPERLTLTKGKVKLLLRVSEQMKNAP